MAAKPLTGALGIQKMSKEEIEKHIAKHPMVVKMAGEINSLRSEQAKEAATQRVETAIREGRLIPAQRDWAIAYCSSDAQGFEKFLGAQPRIIQSGPDGTFTGRIGEAKDDQLSKRELSVCENLGVTAEKFAAAKKTRLSHNVHLD
jgi:phage I-like protein